MPKLKTGGSALSAMVSTASPSRKRSTYSGQSGDLTPSEIASLKADFKRGNDEIDRLIARDAKRGLLKAA